MDQVRSLRARALLERMTIHREPGALLVIGNSCEEVLRKAGRTAQIAQLSGQCFASDRAAKAANLPTMIRRLSNQEFELLFRHGFEVADYTLHAYHSDD